MTASKPPSEARLRSFLVLAVACSAAVPLWSQPSTITGPPNGYVFDSYTQSIRCLFGTPGSAYVGGSVIAARLASVAPNGHSALAVIGATVNLIPDLGQAALSPPMQLEGAIENPDHILWAKDSSAAVLFSSASRSLQFVQQIGAQPSVQPQIDLSRWMTVAGGLETPRPRAGAGRLHISALSPSLLLAADPAAGLAAVATRSRGPSDLYLVQNGASPIWLMKLESASSAAFGADGTLYVADSAAQRVWMVQNPLGSPAIQPLLGAADGINQPVALAAQGQLLYVADGTDKIDAYDLTTMQIADELTLDSSPSTLQYFSATSFLVNASRKMSDPVLILTTSPKPGITFIPSGVQP